MYSNCSSTYHLISVDVHRTENVCHVFASAGIWGQMFGRVESETPQYPPVFRARCRKRRRLVALELHHIQLRVQIWFWAPACYYA